LRGIRKTWKDNTVLDGVDLTLGRGTLTSITGTNGIGKTTLLRIAVALIRPDEGAVELDGLDPLRDRRDFQKRIGFLAAGDRGLYARLTVKQHLALWARISLLRKHEIAPRIDSAVDVMELQQLVDLRVDRLSMGQRQRLRIAMVFMHEPQLVVLDEPLNSLDEAGGDLLSRRLEELASRGGACLWCSPGTDSPAVRFDRELLLTDGRLEKRQGT
jgi:ABC-type multidrug transport system ATPase subunit